MDGNAAERMAGEDIDALWADRFWTKGYRADVPPTIDAELDRWPSMSAMFAAEATRFADREGFVSLGSALTYGCALSDVQAFAAWLASRGIGKGDRVALMMPNCLQYPVALFGILAAGAVVVNVNPLYTPRELEHQLVDSGAVAIVIMEMFAHTLAEVRDRTALREVVVTAMGDMLGPIKGLAITAMMRYVQKIVPRYSLPGAQRWPAVMRRARKMRPVSVEIAPGDLAFLQYTGGTSGVAKGAMLTHSNVIANVLQGRVWALGQMSGDEIVTNVTLLPLYHIFSLTANLLMFSGVGGRNILIANPRDTKRVEWILRKETFAGLAGVNTLFDSLLRDEGFRARDFSSLRMTIAGGMPLHQSTAREWQAVTGRPIVEGYGLTECSPIVCIGMVDLDRPEAMGFTGKVGLPVPSTEVRMRRTDGSWAGFDEPGELCVRGPQVMRGYWNRPAETAAVLSDDGWLATGDVGTMDRQGLVQLVDRIKDIILVSGFNVYPSEIEDVIALHPDVLEVGVIGVPDARQGERIKAIVVPRSPALTEGDLLAHCRRELTGYKVPRTIELREEPLPRTEVGKLLRRELR